MNSVSTPCRSGCGTSASLSRCAATGPAVLCAATAGAADAVGSGCAADANKRYDAARDQYEVGHFQVAFDEFGTLADGGHCEAARMARQMVRLGRAHYGVDFAVAPSRLEHWQHLPRCNAAQPGRRAEPPIEPPPAS